MAQPALRGALMVCGTASDAGKSSVVTGLCRLLARRGVSVAPFKARNMSLNSYVTKSGHEIARAQAHQAAAAMTEPAVEMNPVLLKPTPAGTSQLVVMGRPVGEVGPGGYARPDAALTGAIGEALATLRSRHDVVIAEGAGGAAEINLLPGDVGNLPLARKAGLPALLVGDIERGGVFASIYGTFALLPSELRAQLAGFVVNKMRGDPSLLEPGLRELERRCERPCLGVLPHVGPLVIDAEDSLALERRAEPERAPSSGDVLDVAVVRLPHLANFTDFDPLWLEPGVSLRYVSHPGEIARADLVVLPGSKATVADLIWLERRGLGEALRARARGGRAVLGICAGYQMLGRRIRDEVESGLGEVPGLGLIEGETLFRPEKLTARRRGSDRAGRPVVGYEIRHGEPPAPSGHFWLSLGEDSGDVPEGVADEARGIFATSLHGLFENDELRGAFLATLADRSNKHFVASPLSFEERRQAQIDLLADLLERHLDLGRVAGILADGAR